MSSAPSRKVEANDNRRAAGEFADGRLTLRLVAEQGVWQPEGPNGRTLSVQAFREEAGTLSIPGPLLRVPAGTEIRVSVRNAVPGTSMRVFGLHDRSGSADSGLEIPAGETRRTVFPAGSPGTYHYWATTTGSPVAGRLDVDSQLGGAIVIDPPGPRPDDRVMVIGVWRKPGTSPGENVDVGTINGRSWPLTDILDYRVGDIVRWHVVNLSFDSHGMHLHGQYFRVLGTGDGSTFQRYADTDQWSEVTHRTAPGATLYMQWIPERLGNWLFHCHMTVHMTPPRDTRPHSHRADDSAAGMAGLVVGIRVTGSSMPGERATSQPKRFTLHLREEPGRYGNMPGYRVDAEGIDTWRLAPGSLPGPVIVLRRGEPVEVSLVNEMHDSTAIHWHGIELESYFDGVPGWGGIPGSITPLIMPGQSFTAKFTPPRAGTFIYHTHAHDDTQLSGGLYGALIVLEPGERFDPTTDHVFIAGYDGPEDALARREPIVINGVPATVPAIAPGPTAHALRAGVPNRIRLINITPNNVALTFVLSDGFVPVSWRALAKDGADLSAAQQTTREARQLVSVGETYDFAVTPTPRQRLWLNLVRGNGEWVAQRLLVAGP
jgi:FtsP/CotA-like multicopper oxidase with cupredoxin domain